MDEEEFSVQSLAVSRHQLLSVWMVSLVARAEDALVVIKPVGIDNSVPWLNAIVGS